MTTSNRTLIVIGSGPGIGRSVTALFASKRYSNVALIARRAEKLKEEQAVLEEAVGQNLNIKTFAVDVADGEALLKALGEAESHFGKAECIFFNAARVLPSKLLEHEVKEIEYDFRINVSALYTVAQRQIPQLLELVKNDPSAIPSIIVTSSMLPQEPQPFVFALSLVKAAQRNLVQSLQMTYGNQGIFIGLINVGGPVSPDHSTLNPSNIAARAWEWFAQAKENPTFEVKI